MKQFNERKWEGDLIREKFPETNSEVFEDSFGNPICVGCNSTEACYVVMETGFERSECPCQDCIIKTICMDLCDKAQTLINSAPNSNSKLKYLDRKD